jgi:predicted SAM-dependent methyltransferase
VLKKIIRLFKKKHNITQAAPPFDSHLYNLYNEASKVEKKFVNLGSGLFPHPYWTCVDIKDDNKNMYPDGFPEDYINFNFNDQAAKLPFEDNDIEIFYSSHCIEHLFDNSILNLFKEIFRSLKKGGLVRITCPDINLALNALETKNRYFFDPKNNHQKKSIEELFYLEWVDPICKEYMNINLLRSAVEGRYHKELEFLNKIFEVKEKKKLNGHINFLTEDKIFNFFKKVGFSNYKAVRYSQSHSPVFLDGNYFEKNYQNISLFVEAIK